jgi:hypothetical protein
MLGVVAHLSSQAGGKSKIGRSQFRKAWAKSDSTSKITRAKKAGGMTQVIRGPAYQM